MHANMVLSSDVDDVLHHKYVIMSFSIFQFEQQGSQMFKSVLTYVW